MSKNKAFDRRYSINVARLKLGENTEKFTIGSEFLDHFDRSMVEDADLNAILLITKYNTHLDVRFQLNGTIEIFCDRCGEPYNHPLEEEYRIFYSFDSDMKFEGYEVMFTESHENQLSIVQELYDFIHTAIPMRKIADPSVHLCKPEVLEMLGIDENGNAIEDEFPSKKEKNRQEESFPTDPRWEKLKQLKDKWEDS